MEQFDLKMEELEEMKIERERLCKALLVNPYIQTFLIENRLPERFVYDHAFRLQDYAKQIEVCKNCMGLDYCMQPINGHVYTLTYENNILDTVLKACNYFNEMQASRAHKAFITINDMGDEQLQYRFDNIDFTRENDGYLALVHGLLNSMKSPYEKGYYIYGDPGVGKTYLACCIVNDYACKRVNTAFVHVPTLVADLKTMMYEHRNFKSMIQKLRNVEILILDDLGGESASSWSRDDILLPLLNERMEKQRKTYVTSNYSLLELEKFYTLKSNAINDQVGAKRLVERIRACMSEKRLQAKNRRI